MQSYLDIGFDENLNPTDKIKREYISGVNSDTFIEGVDAGQIMTLGEIRSPRNTSQLRFDDQTGRVIFSGEVEAGAIISGEVRVGTDAWIIDGNPENPRIILYNDGVPEIVIGEI